jgi:hypothetical protein
MEFFKVLWGDHQTEIVSFAKSLLISLVVLAVAWCVAKVVKKLIANGVKKLHHVRHFRE